MGIIGDLGRTAEKAGKAMQGIHGCYLCGRDIKGNSELCFKCFSRNKKYLSKEWFD